MSAPWSASDQAPGEIALPEPLDPAHPPPLRRYCDLILTGGLTDGVIYPWAALDLARRYRFKNIGGSSVGAMAAALVAAAEYGRRRGNDIGFNEVLRRLPEKLSQTVDGRTKLLRLFQPAAATKTRRSTRRLFDLFVGLFSPDTAARGMNAIRRYVQRILGVYRCPALFGLLLALALGFGIIALWHWLVGPAPGLSWGELGIVAIVLAVVLAILVVPACVAFEIWRDLVEGVVPNDFGLCQGGHVKGVPDDEPALTEWLYYGIQEAAAKKLDEPLTFADLWDAPGGPDESPKPPAQTKKRSRSIDLRMVTTNLTHGRPYGLPLDDKTCRLFFRIEELEPFFPPQIMRHLAKSRPYAPAGEDDPPANHETRGLLELPKGDLPVVVAARLSLSFPLLFSTVPLWAIDYEPAFEKRTLRRCRFSDGGICSNFPIHMFDSAVPEWPTFGILLSRRREGQANPSVWIPQRHDQGHFDRWDLFSDEKSPLDQLSGFVKAIIWAAKDWNDRTTVRMPGVRDRVVNVYFKENEGGLNITLSEKEILDLARNYGPPAGQALIDRFVDSAPQAGLAQGWIEHRWVRFNGFLTALRERLSAFEKATEEIKYTRPMSRQIADATATPPLEDPDSSAGRTLTDAQARDLASLLAALKDLETAFSQAVMAQPYEPQPEPELRNRAPL